MSRFWRTLVAMIGGLTVLFAPTAAWAGSNEISVNTGGGWTHDPATPLFDFSRITPGWRGSATIAVRNDSDLPGTVGLSATNVVEDENGCNRPEGYVDTTCTGTDSGELGKEIVLSVYADPNNDGSYDTTPAWSGTIEDLQQPATLATRLSAGEASTYKIDAELPTSSGNETQTDLVSFDLEVTLDGTSVAVQGTKVTRQSDDGPLHHVLAELPLTGTPAERIAAAGLSLLIVGTALVLAGTRRRRKGTF